MNHKMSVVRFDGNQLPTFNSICKDQILGLSPLQIVSLSYYLKKCYEETRCGYRFRITCISSFGM